MEHLSSETQHRHGIDRALIEHQKTGDFWTALSHLAKLQLDSSFANVDVEEQDEEKRVREGKDFLENNLSVFNARIEQLGRELQEFDFSSFNSKINNRPLESVKTELLHVQAQKNTLLLMLNLHDSHFDIPADEDLEAKTIFSEKNMVIEFRDRQDIRRFLGVVKWLEDRASTEGIEKKGSGNYWRTEKVISAIKKEKGAIEYRRTVKAIMTAQTLGSNEQDVLVDQLDPDVLLRNSHKQIHAKDLQEEIQLVNFVWKYIRAGQMDEAVELCRNYKQAWRAATLKGGQFWDDNQEEGGDVQGNRRRLLWKLACRRLASNTPVPAEQAIYALLGGDMAQVLHTEVLQTWEDYCWAYFKTMVSYLEDSRLIERPAMLPQDPQNRRHYALEANIHSELGVDDRAPTMDVGLLKDERRKLLPTPEQNGIATSPQQIFSKLQQIWAKTSLGTKAKTTDQYGTDKYRKIQENLILQRYPALAALLVETKPLADFNENVDLLTEPEHCSYTAFAVHLYIYFFYFAPLSTKDPLEHDQQGLALFRTHIKFLKQAERYDALVTYCKFLPQQDRIKDFGSFLIGVDENTRRTYLEKARTDFSPSDVVGITDFLATWIMQNELPGQKNHLSTQVEFLLSYLNAALESAKPEPLDDALAKANALTRQLVERRGLVEARHLRDTLRPLIRNINFTLVARATHNEYLSWYNYIESYCKLENVNTNIVRPTLPRPLEAESALHLNNPGGYSSLMQAKKRYQEQDANWHEEVRHQQKTLDVAVDHIYSTLTMDGGWLTDSARPQLEGLRKKCVPELTLLLARYCQHCGAHNYVVYKIAELIMREPTDGSQPIYKVFSQDDLKAFQALAFQSHEELLAQKQVEAHAE